MRNRAMLRKLATGAALDVENIAAPEQAEDVGSAFHGVYRLATYEDGKDYCVGSTEQWIWSIGKRLSDGAIFASTDGRFYQNPAFECLWLR